MRTCVVPSMFMRKILQNQEVLKNCKIFGMLAAQDPLHVSFHTPGHKVGGWDITELSYSDNLSCPVGCIAEAEQDIAQILGAVCSPQRRAGTIPKGHTVSALKENVGGLLAEADALFLTSPDYYGNIADLAAARAYCDATGKLLIIDGAHGGHLHFDRSVYAGTYADLWVDGVHKSLPALTQGAVVSARTEELGEKLRLALDIFRTTSPSYPIMASVEYAVKYPQNTRLENAVKAFIAENGRVYCGGDWTKLCAVFGENAFSVEHAAQQAGLYAEFCDGNVVTFYLSPATKTEDFERLATFLKDKFLRYPLTERVDDYDTSPLLLQKNGETEWVDLGKATGRICARTCGLFPPCTPLIQLGERMTAEKIALLQKADNVFGLRGAQVEVFKEK